jgi:hypothetical protein
MPSSFVYAFLFLVFAVSNYFFTIFSGEYHPLIAPLCVGLFFLILALGTPLENIAKSLREKNKKNSEKNSREEEELAG